MNKLTFGEQIVTCKTGDTVLDTLLNNNLTIPNSCRQGACQSCLMRCLNTKPPAASQIGLKDVLQEQKYFLACICYPEQDMTISLGPQANLFTPATVISKEILNPETILITIACEQPLDYYAGQFVNLRRADGLTRSYSIANSRKHAEKMTFHVRRLAGGQFSQWVHQELSVGDSIEVSDPQGLCFYLPNRQEQNLLLIGTGSGLAPLAGIIHEALEQGHSGEIHLFHGSREMDGLYWIDEMHELQKNHPNFHYTPCVSRGDTPEGVARGRANEVAMSTLAKLKDWRVYLCGHPEMVNQAKIHAFLNGASSKDIHADAFHVASASLD